MESPSPVVLAVSVDGAENGHFHSVQEAVDAVPYNNKTPTTITISPGTYTEQVLIPFSKDFITFEGRGGDPSATVVQYGAFKDMPGGPDGQPYNTSTSATVQLKANSCRFVNLTIKNTAGPNCGGDSGQHQAVAMHVEGNRTSFYACHLLGHQDTLYAHHGLQYYEACTIEGTVDFIFGGPDTKAFFNRCNLTAVGPGWFTAMYRDLINFPEDDGAFVFTNCVFEASPGVTGNVYLGRPWRSDARIIIASCHIGQCVPPEGWTAWDDFTDPTRPIFWECGNIGPGAADPVSTSRRSMGKQVNPEDVAQFVDVDKFFGEDRSFLDAPPNFPRQATGTNYQEKN